MNIVTMMQDAMLDRKNLSHEKNEKSFKNLLSHGFKKMEAVYRSHDAEYGDTLFMVVQDILIWLMFADSNFYQGEYDAYLQYCNWAGFKPLSVEKCVNRKKELTIEYLITLIKHIAATRNHIPEEDYESFVKSLCYMSLFGDKEIDHDEYGLLSCFFNKEDDYCPSWEDFKKEW